MEKHARYAQPQAEEEKWVPVEIELEKDEMTPSHSEPLLQARLPQAEEEKQKAIPIRLEEAEITIAPSQPPPHSALPQINEEHRRAGVTNFTENEITPVLPEPQQQLQLLQWTQQDLDYMINHYFGCPDWRLCHVKYSCQPVEAHACKILATHAR